jgi:hypothetical protein
MAKVPSPLDHLPVMYWEAWSAVAEKLAAKRALEAAASKPWWLDQEVSEPRAVPRQAHRDRP